MASPAEPTKRCPFCAEEILAAAIRCKHCHAALPATSPELPATSPEPPALAGPDGTFGVVALIVPLIASGFIWFWAGQLKPSENPFEKMLFIGATMVALTAIFVTIEAARVGAAGKQDHVGLHPALWFVAVAAIWFVGFPAWFKARATYGLPNRLAAAIGVVVVYLCSSFAPLVFTELKSRAYNRAVVERSEEREQGASTEPARRSKTPAEEIDERPTAPSAFAYARPLMSDEFNKHSDGSLLFALWSMKHLKWTDVYVSKDETTHALVQKDTDDERGKRMCISGTVVQIESEKVGNGRVFHCIVMSYSQKSYSLLAVGSSGSLVAQSDARFCGFVTGRFDYSNSIGGTAHAVDLVGMFQLSENVPLGAGR